MAISSSKQTAENLASALQGAASSCAINCPPYYAHSDCAVEGGHASARGNAVVLAGHIQTILDNDATLLLAAANMFANTDAAIATDILNGI